MYPYAPVGHKLDSMNSHKVSLTIQEESQNTHTLAHSVKSDKGVASSSSQSCADIERPYKAVIALSAPHSIWVPVQDLVDTSSEPFCSLTPQSQ